MTFKTTTRIDSDSAINVLNAYMAATSAPAGHVIFLWLNPHSQDAGWMCFECEDHESDEYDSGGYYWPSTSEEMAPELATGILKHFA